MEDVCIIHCSSCDDNEKLVSLKDIDSWNSLLEASRIRNHRAILGINERLKENEIPKISYHRKCRALFTLKRELEKIKKRKREENDEREEGNSDKRPCRRSSTEGEVGCTSQFAYFVAKKNI